MLIELRKALTFKKAVDRQANLRLRFIMKVNHHSEVTINCLVCGSRSHLCFMVHDGYKIARCHTCGFIFVNPRPSEESLLRLYLSRDDNPYFSNQYEPLKYELPVLLKVIRVIRNYIREGQLLEVGCGRGDFLRVAQTSGFSVTGCDVFGGDKPDIDDAVLYDGPLKSAKFPDECFDVVVARNTFEHLFDTNVEIREIRRVLKPNGHLYLKVPNVQFEQGVLCRLLFGKGHKFTPPYHLNHFSPKSLQALLKRTGFQFTSWYLEQPTVAPNRLGNIVRQTGHRLFQTLHFISGRTLPCHPTLSCLCQKTSY